MIWTLATSMDMNKIVMRIMMGSHAASILTTSLCIQLNLTWKKLQRVLETHQLVLVEWQSLTQSQITIVDVPRLICYIQLWAKIANKIDMYRRLSLLKKCQLCKIRRSISPSVWIIRKVQQPGKVSVDLRSRLLLEALTIVVSTVASSNGWQLKNWPFCRITVWKMAKITSIESRHRRPGASLYRLATLLSPSVPPQRAASHLPA